MASTDVDKGLRVQVLLESITDAREAIRKLEDAVGSITNYAFGGTVFGLPLVYAASGWTFLAQNKGLLTYGYCTGAFIIYLLWRMVEEKRATVSDEQTSGAMCELELKAMGVLPPAAYRFLDRETGQSPDYKLPQITSAGAIIGGMMMVWMAMAVLFDTFLTK